MRTGNSNRWTINLKDATAESGANAGSNFTIAAWDDSANVIGNVLTITRATRIVTFSVSPVAPTPTAGDNSTKLATTAFVQALAAGYQPLDPDLTTLAAATPFFLGLSNDATAADMRTSLALAAVAASGSASDLGTGTLPSARLPASLASIYALTPADNDMMVWSNPTTAVVFTTTAYGRGLLNLADAAALLASAGAAAAVHAHVVADVTGLQAALDGKQPAAAALTTLASATPAFLTHGRRRHGR